MKKMLLVMVAGVLSFSVMADNGLPDQAFVEVYGEGVLTVPVDRIEIRLVLAAGANDGATARKKVDASLAEVARILREQKVPDDALEAYQLRITEQHDYVDEEYKSVGYLAERTVTLTLRDLDRVELVMDALVDAPIQIWEEIRALPADVAKTRRLARAAAIEDARQRAEDYARLVDRRLGNAYRVGDDVDWEIKPKQEVYALAAVGGSNGVAIFRVGDIEVKQQVRVIYLLD